MEISTEEAQEFLNQPGRLVIRLPLFRGNDVVIDRAVGFIQSLEENGADVEVIVFSKNALTHEKIVSTEKRNTKAKTAQWVIDGLHLDYLPYTDVMISMRKSGENAALLEKLCVRYGVLDADEIIVKS